MGDYRLKNYYILQNFEKVIEKYDVISFDVFDTLLIRNVLAPTDIFKLLDSYVENKYNINGFYYVRINEEQNARQKSNLEDITLSDIYSSIEKHLNMPCDDIKQKELELEKEYTAANPFSKQLFEIALKSGKRIIIISDMYLPTDFIEQLLTNCGYKGYEKVFVSGEVGKSKYAGTIYQYLIDNYKLDAAKWLHVGDNYKTDVENAREYGISAFYYKPIRERADEDRIEKQKDEKNNQTDGKNDKFDIEQSIKEAKEINAFYCSVKHPSDETVIRISDVSMMFNMSREKVDNLKEYIIKLIKGQLMFQEFWALKNISFEVKKGEKVGLIGLNGSGKSTLLKIVSGVLKPTKGKVEVHGSIAPLIELGAGFDVNLSAKENIFLNGAILGYSHENMEDHYDEIIEFAELKEFEDVPIKNFSSGMVARLGFAIATCHVPDILIIDEILSVGDFEFQKKCHAKMRELTEHGATVLFVSHSSNDIIEMCDKAVWLDHGQMIDIGEAEYIVNKYLNK